MNQPTTNPTYEEKMQKLRDAGVIDMELSFGCEIKNYKGEYRKLIGFNPPNDLYLRKETYEKGHILYGTCEIDIDMTIGCKKLGHDLTYGRACWWIEENEKLYYKARLDYIWKQKHLPLSQQENKSDLVDFIYNLIQGQQ